MKNPEQILEELTAEILAAIPPQDPTAFLPAPEILAKEKALRFTVALAKLAADRTKEPEIEKLLSALEKMLQWDAILAVRLTYTGVLDFTDAVEKFQSSAEDIGNLYDATARQYYDELAEE